MFRSLGFCVLALLAVSNTAHAKRYHFLTTSDSAKFDSKLVRGESATQDIVFELTVPRIDIDPAEDGFDRMVAPGLYPIGQAGAPDLFTTGKLFVVPPGFEPSLEVLSESSQRIENVRIAPFQHRTRCEIGNQSGFEFNRSLYERQGSFPKQSYLLESVGKLQDARLMRVVANPIRMDLANKALEVTTHAQLKVSFKRVGESTPLRLSRSFRRIVGETAANGLAIESFLSENSEPEVMYVFVADALKSSPALATLIDWNRSKGLQVKVLSLTEAGGSKESIKDLLQKEYDTGLRPTFVLFVGDKDSMPPFYVMASGSAASEYPFSLLSGDDIIPDVLYGRLLAEDEQMVKAQVDRWIAYERNPDHSSSWYKLGTTIASKEGSNPSDAEYADRVVASLEGNTYTTVDKYRQEEKNATPENIIDSLERGASWLAYFGHGSGTSWGNTNGTFNSDVVSDLQSTRLPFIVDVACANGNYHRSNGFGRTWVTAERNGESVGAVAFYGGTVNISWHPPAIMSEGIAKYHFEKPVYSMGASTLAGQLFLVEQKGTGSSVVDNMEWYALFGDPSTMVRTDTPKNYQVRYEKLGNRFRVTAFNSIGLGVAGLRVALHNPERADNVVTGYTNEQGLAEMKLSGLTGLEPGTLLTVTGYNAETVQLELP